MARRGSASEVTEDRVSLAPLDPETALRALLRVGTDDRPDDQDDGPDNDEAPAD